MRLLLCKKEIEKSKKDTGVRKHSLISAIIGMSIAIFTFICCGLLVPLGLIGAAVFLHQYRIPLIILGVAIAGISVFFMLRGKEIICVCKAFDRIKKYKRLAIISSSLVFCVGLVFFLSSNFFTAPTKNLSSGVISEPTILEWKNNKVESGLVNLVNFLEGNIGNEIELTDQKHIITGKEAVSIKITMLECCTKKEFAEMLDAISKTGLVRNSDFSQKEILAELPVEEIPKIAEIWNVEKISLESDAKILWKSIIKGF